MAYKRADCWPFVAFFPVISCFFQFHPIFPIYSSLFLKFYTRSSALIALALLYPIITFLIDSVPWNDSLLLTSCLESMEKLEHDHFFNPAHRKIILCFTQTIQNILLLKQPDDCYFITLSTFGLNYNVKYYLKIIIVI